MTQTAPTAPAPPSFAPIPAETGDQATLPPQSVRAYSPRLGWHFEGLALHLLLSIVMTWPLLLNLGSDTLVPGVMEEDRAQNLWNLWWVKTALLDQHTNPFFTNMIWYPEPVSLQFHTLNVLNGLISIPLQFFMPLTAIYSLIVLFSFFMAGWGAYLLIIYVLERWFFERGLLISRPVLLAAALAGSCAFAYSAFHIATMRGQLQMISLEWAPFYVLFLMRALHDWPLPLGRDLWGRWLLRGALPAAFFLLLVALIDWYFTMYMLLFSVFYGIYLLARGLIERRGQTKEMLSYTLTLAVRFGLVVAIFFVFVSWMLIPMFAELQTATYMRPAPGYATENAADLFAFFMPPRMQTIWGRISDFRVHWPFGGQLYEVYFGYVALAVAGFGLFWRLGKRKLSETASAARLIAAPSRAFWAVLVALFFTLALGPVLQFNGVEYPAIQPMPYTIIDKIPGFNISRSPDRFDMPLTLCLGILVAFGTARLAGALLASVNWRRAALASGAVIALMAFELWPVPYVQQEAPIPHYFQQMGQDPADYSILELPRQDDYWHGAFHMYFQTAHHKRIFGGYISREYPHPFLSSTPGYMQFEDIALQPDLFQDGPNEWLTALADQDTRYVVLYTQQWRRKPSGADYDAYRAVLRGVLGDDSYNNPVHSDEQLEVYRVPQPAERVPYLSLGNGWYPREVGGDGRSWRWMLGLGQIEVHSDAAFTGTLAFTANSFHRPRHLEVALNGQVVGTIEITNDVQQEYSLPNISFPAGTATITFRSLDAPEVPSQLSDSTDSRLLSFQFSAMRIER